MNKKKVLFLCTGNSARSQMAEGFINHLLSDHWQAYSAGTRPACYVHPLAITVMAELGIDISEQWSKSTEEFRDRDFDLVITVCDNAAKTCPTWLGKGRKVHIGFPDPAMGEGGELARMQLFRQIRDAIRERIVPFLESFEDVPEDTRRLNFMAQGSVT